MCSRRGAVQIHVYLNLPIGDTSLIKHILGGPKEVRHVVSVNYTQKRSIEYHQQNSNKMFVWV